MEFVLSNPTNSIKALKVARIAKRAKLLCNKTHIYQPRIYSSKRDCVFRELSYGFQSNRHKISL